MPLFAAACALAALHLSNPDYLLHAGFPLDDAWIHAVYARELAHTGTLAYNPGIAATGETAPAWALILAVIHRMAPGVPSVVFMTKTVGFLFHALSAILVALALRRGRAEGTWPALVGGTLVAIHPDLLAASVSGMEVPLATAVVAGLVVSVFRGRATGVALLATVAVAARPETVVIAIVLPLLFWGRSRAAMGVRLALVAGVGATVSMGLLAIRNMIVSGLPLPATFYAKAHTSSLFDVRSQVLGWVGELGQLPPVGSVAFLLGLVMLSAVVLIRRRADVTARMGAALYLAGAAFCAVSFALVPPADPGAFYWQRYVLPALLPMLAGVALLAKVAIDHIPGGTRSVASVAVAACLVAATAWTAPSRFSRFANDAHNIDDVQVQLGRTLATAAPSDIAWMVDAGAARYFGRAFVVDLVGLNTPMLLGPGAQAFLDLHPPSYLDVFAGWSDVKDGWPSVTPARVFQPSTPYTVSASAAMRQHVLVSCDPLLFQGQLRIGPRTVAFRCAQ